MAILKTKNNTDNRQIAIYARKSKITETGKSIEIQKEKCIQLACTQFNVTQDELTIYEDEGKSGFYADRPEYKKMLKDIENNKIRAVVCYKIDRISRRTVDLLNLIQQMEQNNIAFVSVSDRELDTSTRTGKIMISLLSAVAEFERDIIAERITDNMYELAKEGRWLGGECPLGYFSQKEKLMTNGKKTTINRLGSLEKEQLTVKLLFETFLQTTSFTGTATILNNKGLKTKKGKIFSLTAIKNILQNPVYAIADTDMQSYFTSLDVTVWADEHEFDGIRGIMAYNKTEQTKEMDKASRTLEPKYTQKSSRRDIKDWIISVGKHKGLINGADWIRVQNIISKISKENSARPKEVSKALLSGLVRCSECGSRMFVRAESGRYNLDGSVRFGYRCDVKYRKKGNCKTSPNIKGYDLDNFVIEQICSINSKDNTIYSEILNTKHSLLLNLKEAEQEECNSKRIIYEIDQNIQHQIVNLRSAPEKIKQAIYADIEVLQKSQEENQLHLNKIQNALQANENQLFDIIEIKETIMNFPKLVHLIDYEAKLQLLRQILEYIVIKGDIVHIFLKSADKNSNFTNRACFH